MARIFISYSRVDRGFVDDLADKLRRIYGHDNIWFDEGLHGGDIWWEEILDQIAVRDIFIYVLTNEAVQSPYCQAEFTEARRLQKQIITVQARDRTKLTDELGDIHYINMAGGVDDADALTDLIRSVNKRMTKVARRRVKPLWEPCTSKPRTVTDKPRPADAPDIDTPTLEVPRLERERAPGTNSRLGWGLGAAAVAAILIAIIIAILSMTGDDSAGDSKTETNTPDTQVAGVDTPAPTNAAQPSDAPTANLRDTLTPTDNPTPTETLTLIPTYTPTLSATEFEQTVQAEMALALTENAQTANAVETQTAVAQTATAYTAVAHAAETAAMLTVTATHWTRTPTPDARGTANARLTATQEFLIAQATANAIATNTRFMHDQTATATLWTDTPTPTDTPTVTLTPSYTPMNTPSPPPTATPDPLQAALDRARNFSGSNDDWEPFVQEFDGVEMVLVPAGCFEMGSTTYNDEKPVHTVCFDEPFWIDRYEVSNGQFDAVNGQAADTPYFSGADLPRESITRSEATDFCETRQARLPTEAEWEYAARGPDALIYPWGNEWDCSVVNADDDTVGCDGFSGTSPVGSFPAGVSWVGALDMSGNVWEWVNDWYSADYYDTLEDGVVNPTGPSAGEYRVLRGGSWGSLNSGGFRAALRSLGGPDLRLPDLGFRCARSIK